MPITDVPPSPPTSPEKSPEKTRPPEPPFKRGKRTNYDEMEPHELLGVIDELEDERSRARRREGIWVSVLAHILIFWYLAYGPRYFQHVHVVNPSDILKQREKDMTYLDLPKDALKNVTPRPLPKSTPPPQARVDSKTLESLRAPKPVAPPKQQAQQTDQPPPPAPVQQEPKPQPAPSQPLPPSAQSQVEAPHQAPTQPSFQTGQSTPGEAVRDAARAAAKSGMQSGGGGSLGAPGKGQAAGLQGGAQVLTDTGGWDYGPYIRRVVYDTKQSWYPIIPEEVRAPLLKKGVVGIRFKIYRDGSVHDETLESRSGDVALDRAAWGGITGASPYPPLPAEFKGPYLELRFGFFYNQDPDLQ